MASSFALSAQVPRAGDDHLPPQRVRRLVERVAGALRGDLQDLPVGVAEVDAVEPAPVVRPAHRHAGVGQASLPLQQPVVGRHAHGHVVHPADPPAAARRVRPLEEGQQRARAADGIAEVQVVRAGIVEVDGALYQPQPQHVAVEVQRALRVGRHHGHVVQPVRGQRFHRSSSSQTLRTEIQLCKVYRPKPNRRVSHGRGKPAATGNGKPAAQAVAAASRRLAGAGAAAAVEACLDPTSLPPPRRPEGNGEGARLPASRRRSGRAVRRG
jgi:hypothetical protein